VAVPATLIETVQRATPAQIDEACASGRYPVGDEDLPFYWLGALLQQSARGTEDERARSVVVIRSAQQRVAIHVDEVLGNQEAIVKNLGPQLSRLPGLAGITLLASGAVALIYNPVALAALYGAAAHAMMRAGHETPAQRAAKAEALAASAAPLVLVVDDSLTVRRVTQRLLVREGYRVALAKDGLDALERLAEETPRLVLSDIEMPRMDGFDLVRKLRADSRFADLPVIMITSRIAQKHRDVAAELGIEHYLGKPYSEEDLLALIARYTTHVASA
jgi:chemosensory pili system protein ChpA (sensor histidine kinase/response regulator)